MIKMETEATIVAWADETFGPNVNHLCEYNRVTSPISGVDSCMMCGHVFGTWSFTPVTKEG
jgi:hypothetical protein